MLSVLNEGVVDSDGAWCFFPAFSSLPVIEDTLILSCLVPPDTLHTKSPGSTSRERPHNFIYRDWIFIRVDRIFPSHLRDEKDFVACKHTTMFARYVYVLYVHVYMQYRATAFANHRNPSSAAELNRLASFVMNSRCRINRWKNPISTTSSTRLYPRDSN